jgi:hypothetical protein
VKPPPERVDLLARIGPRDVKSEPFPHVIVRFALPEETVDTLIESLPPQKTFTAGARPGSNRRFSLPARDALRSDAVSPLWRDLLLTCTSQPFFARLMEIFGPHVRALYPEIEKEIGPLSRVRTGLRFRDGFDRADVLLDALISINTPVTRRASAVRRVHVDSPHKLFAGLFYLRGHADDSTGGELEICRFRDGSRGFRDAEVADRHVEVVETVPYERNTLVLYLNALNALHGVTVRQRTPYTRLFLNIVGEVRQPLFDLSAHQEPSLLRAIIPAWARRAARSVLEIVD